MTLPLPLFSDRWWVVQSFTNPKLLQASNGLVREMSWKNEPEAHKYLSNELRDQIKDKVQINFIRGSWVLIQLEPGYILAEYHTWSQAGGSLPDGVASSFLEGL